MIAKDGTDASPLSDHHLEEICRILVAAGDEVMDVYTGSFSVDRKADDSPLTEADRRAHTLILERLTSGEALPVLPVLSEEGAHESYEIRHGWRRYWLVDPLDGTKEFVKRNDEFTVNIALIQNGRPVLGGVYAPALQVLDFGTETEGAFRLAGTAARTVDRSSAERIHARATRPGGDLRVVASRSHLNEETEAFISVFERCHGACERVSRGSSLKICLVAEGSADVYPRFAPTMEWDTAAGDAVARAAGAIVTETDATTPVVYNKKDLLNPFFIVRAPWLAAGDFRC